MAKSKIVITFNSIPAIGTKLWINNDLSATVLKETFDDIRTFNGVTLIGANVDECAFNYLTALNLDYNSGGLYIITVLNNVVTIEAVQDGVTFTETNNTTSGAVTTVDENEPATPELTIDDITFSEADTNPCDNIKVTVTTSELATKVTSPLLIDPNNDNPFSFDWVRQVIIDIICKTATLNANQTIATPEILSVGTTQINIVNTPTGGDVTVTHDLNVLLELEYSLDGILWQSGFNANKFTGLVEDSYTMYVRDQFGCEITIPFEITVFTPDISVTDAFNYLAKEMSIRFKRNQVWDFCNIYRIEENTLSCEEKVENAYKIVQKFQTCDIITTQFLSNYDTLEANVIKEDLSRDVLTISKKSNNIGTKDKRDATYYNAENNQTGIYYTSGDTYNYDTGFPNGTYALNGALPNYGAIGNFILLDGEGWFEIVNIIYSEEFNADVLIINFVYTGIPTQIIVSSEYNQKNYEVYEFDIDMSSYENQEIQVELLLSDAVFDDYNYLSEKIEVAERWNDTLEFIWYNTTDTWVFYSTGIKNKARVYFQTFEPGNDSELDIHKTDITTIMINSESYETMNLILGSFADISTGIKRQLTLASIHKEFYIDKEQFVSNSEPETEPIKFTNQSVLTFSLTKTGKVFNSEWNGQGNAIESLELVGLIEYDNTNYLKY
jgi:hypothetical protein